MFVCLQLKPEITHLLVSNVHTGESTQINVCLSIALCSGVPQSGGVEKSPVSCVNHHHFKPLWFKETTDYKSKNKGRDQTVERR